MLRLEKYKPEHIEAVHGREDIERKWVGIGATPVTMAHFCDDGQPAYTAFDDNRVIGCAGIYMFWQGVGEAWLWVDAELTEKHKLWFHKTVKKTLWDIIETQHFRRVQCIVEKDFGMGIKWIENLGFKAESEMPSFGPRGETYIRYVILHGD